MDNIFDRSILLLGPEAMQRLATKKVIIFGVGGVGSWCAESLIRSGIMHLTIVDSDSVAPSNINRQLMATTTTVGRPKVEVLRERLLDISPDAEITALQKEYSRENNAAFRLEDYDYIIDCIDTLRHKASLLINATNGSFGNHALPDDADRPFVRATVFSSMGAALKIDPTQIKVAEYWKVRGCPLGAAIRKKMKRAKQTLGKPVLCTYSEELLNNAGSANEALSDLSQAPGKAQVNGTLVHITAIFGFTLAGLVLQHAVQEK